MENLSIRAPEKNNVLEKKPLVEKDEQSKERVFPVPVGDSSKAFCDFDRASMTLDMYSF